MRLLSVRRSAAFASSEHAAYLDLVDTDSAVAISKFRRAKDAQRCLIGRLLPRYLIASSFGVDWSDITFDRTSAGRPFATAPSCPPTFEFNVSHDSEWIVLGAIGPKDKGAQRIGVDVMRVAVPWEDETVDGFIAGLAEQLTEKEMGWIRAADTEVSRLQRTFALWTMKEAYTKALGEGLAFDLKRLEVLPATGTDLLGRYSAYVDGREVSDWHFVLGAIEQDYLLAVVVKGGAQPVVTLEELSLEQMLQVARLERSPVPVGMQDLPHEILQQIVESIGWSSSHYSDKDRQRNLASVARVNSAFLSIARTLLYTTRVWIRNSGRANILARTVRTNAELASRIQSLVFTSEVSHAPSVVTVLERTSVQALEIHGGIIFYSSDWPANVAMLTSLALAAPKLRRAHFNGGGLNSFPHLINLLRYCTQLDELSLDTTTCGFGDDEDLDLSTPPPYSLKKLHWTTTLCLSLETNRWLRGRDLDQLRTLDLTVLPHRDLRLGEDGEDEFFKVALLPALLPAFANITHLGLEPKDVAMDFRPLFGYTPMFPAVLTARLRIGPKIAMVQKLPPKLQVLEIIGSEPLQSSALIFLLKEAPASIREVRLVGYHSTDNLVKEIAKVCSSQDIRLDVRRFG